ncbi:MAG: protein kinase domain-containing protein [Thermoplasmatota archaeon]
MSPDKSAKLKDLHKANVDLEYVIKMHKELSARLEMLQAKHDTLVAQKISSKEMDRSSRVQNHLKNREYENAHRELNRFEKYIAECEVRLSRTKGVRDRFLEIKDRWSSFIWENEVEDGERLLDDVSKAINDMDLQKAEALMNKMEQRMKKGEVEKDRLTSLRSRFKELIDFNQEMIDEEVIDKRELVDRNKVERLFEEKKLDELDALLTEKMEMMEDIKVNFERSTELYEELDDMIDKFSGKGMLKIPPSFEGAIRYYEECDYRNAYKSFKQAKAELDEYFGGAETKFSFKLDMRGTSVKMSRWEEGFLVLKNEGPLHLENIRITKASDNFKIDVDEEKVTVKAGKEERIPIRIQMQEEGVVPIKVKISYKDPMTKDLKEKLKKFRVDVAEAPGQMEEETKARPPLSKRDSIKGRVEEVYKIKDEEQAGFREGDFYSYRIVDKLGAGGFSTVYKVSDGKYHYAMKTPKDIGIEGDETIAIQKKDMLKFKKEASIWATLTDTIPEDVVMLIDMGLEPFPWFVMELADGSLRDHLEGANSRKRLDTAMEILTKFDRIHHLGVVHRDIKPENILYIDGKAKVTDFGISKLVNSTTKSTVGMSGTCFYMSPEQISKSRFGTVDWRTDIWQLGVLTYEILTDHLPFDAEDPYEITSNILHDEPEPISSYAPKLEPIDEILFKALDKDKTKRYQSAIELKFAIEYALKD